MNYKINKNSTQLSLLKDLDLQNDSNHSVRQKIRSKSCKGITIEYHLNCCTLFITVNFEGDEIQEILVHTGQKGGCCTANIYCVSRLINLCLQHGISTSEIMSSLKGVRCPAVSNSQAKGKKFDALSCPDAMARALGQVLDEKQNTISVEKSPKQ